MTAATRVYSCAHCDVQYTNPVALGGHVHAQHPEHRRPVTVPRGAFTMPSRRVRTVGSFKRASDRWPGKP